MDFSYWLVCTVYAHCFTLDRDQALLFNEVGHAERLVQEFLDYAGCTSIFLFLGGLRMVMMHGQSNSAMLLAVLVTMTGCYSLIVAMLLVMLLVLDCSHAAFS